MKNKISFNNGFVTAITLFLEHKNMTSHLIKDENDNIISDLRLYGASDHLFDLEIPKIIPEKLRKKIKQWREKCLRNRLNHSNVTNSILTDKFFKEGEEILKLLDEIIFHTNKVIMRYR